jgi:hypothetical protein
MGTIAWRFSLVLYEKVLNCFQITGMRGEDATKKAPTDSPAPKAREGQWGQKLAQQGAHSPLNQGHRQERIPVETALYHD